MSAMSDPLVINEPTRARSRLLMVEADDATWRTLWVFAAYRVVLAVFVAGAFVFLNRFFNLGIVSPTAVKRLVDAGFARAPVGTGPFMFKEWVSGSHLVLVKNPSYWKPGRPYLDRVIYKIVPDANALLNQLETGDVDTRVRLVNEQIGRASCRERVLRLV